MAFIFPKTATARPEDALEVDTNLPALDTASRAKLYAKAGNKSVWQKASRDGGPEVWVPLFKNYEGVWIDNIGLTGAEILLAESTEAAEATNNLGFGTAVSDITWDLSDAGLAAGMALRTSNTNNHQVILPTGPALFGATGVVYRFMSSDAATQYGALFRGWPGYADGIAANSYDGFAVIGLRDGNNKRAVSLDYNVTGGAVRITVHGGGTQHPSFRVKIYAA